MLLPAPLTALLLLALPSAVHAVFKDEVGHLDFHHQLLGVPQRDTTFFHRPRRDDKASLLYTLSDVNVLGAVNPGTGAVVWRQSLNSTGNVRSGSQGFARAGEGEGRICSALGGSVHGWDAVTGRNVFWADFGGDATVVDLEMMEMTEVDTRKDVLALFDEGGDDGTGTTTTVLRRLNPHDGSVVWEFRETTHDAPLQVSNNVEKVFVISLRGGSTSAPPDALKVTVLDTLTGKKLDSILLQLGGGAKSDAIGSKEDVMFVGANSAAPVAAWTNKERTKLRLNVLGTKKIQEFTLPPSTLDVAIHAPHLVQSYPHFLVHIRTDDGHLADVYHIDLKSGTITKAYGLPLLGGFDAFSVTSNDANVYFTRINTESGGNMNLYSSTSDAVLERWGVEIDLLSKIGYGRSSKVTSPVLHMASEVIKKAGSGDNYALRSAGVTADDEWVLIRNGEVAWTRPEGMTRVVAATFAEIPDREDLVKTLEEEAHSSSTNPLEAYIHRVRRHIHDLQYLPDYLGKLPSRLKSSILGTDETDGVASPDGGVVRDSFGFNKLAVLATKRGMLFGLEFGNKGRLLWKQKVFPEEWDVRGMLADDTNNRITILGAKGDRTVVESDSGTILESSPPGSLLPVQATAVVNSAAGRWLLAVGEGGEMGRLPATQVPGQTVVVRGANGDLRGVTYITNGEDEYVEPTISWIFSPPPGERILATAARPSHDVVASIGRVLGDRRVKYKYLNPNTLVVATSAAASPASLNVFLLDTVSGQILSAQNHTGVDTDRPVECVMAENWFACTFFGQYRHQSDRTQSIKGFHITVSDLYESDEADDRGPLGDSANFSSVAPIDTPATGDEDTSCLLIPSVVSQSFVVPAPLTALQVTQTRQGISSRQLLAYLPETHGLVGIPRTLLEPRRPVGRDPTPQEVEEGLVRYAAAIEIDPRQVVSHERDVAGVRLLLVAPSVVESTSLVLACGDVDVYGTRVVPSGQFDILGNGFDKVSLVATVLALAVGVVALGPMVRKKQINTRWKAPL